MSLPSLLTLAPLSNSNLSFKTELKYGVPQEQVINSQYRLQGWHFGDKILRDGSALRGNNEKKAKDVFQAELRKTLEDVDYA